MGSVIIEGGTHTVPVKKGVEVSGGGGGDKQHHAVELGEGGGGGGETHVVPVERAGGGYETRSSSGTEGCLLYKRVLYAYK